MFSNPRQNWKWRSLTGHSAKTPIIWQATKLPGSGRSGKGGGRSRSSASLAHNLRAPSASHAEAEAGLQGSHSAPLMSLHWCPTVLRHCSLSYSLPWLSLAPQPQKVGGNPLYHSSLRPPNERGFLFFHPQG